jgi:AcrR family transcriptional regulator
MLYQLDGIAMLDTLSSQSTKTRIMDAAEDIVIEQGASHLTFDELVKQTGLSKGGILYHYPSKKILLRAMVQRMVMNFENRRDRLASEIGHTGGLTGAKTYILASFEQYERKDKSSMALMAAAANDPELLDPIREHYRRNFDEIRAMGGKYAALATILFMALDGIWLLDSMKLCTMDHAERMAMKNLLLKMADV